MYKYLSKFRQSMMGLRGLLFYVQNALWHDDLMKCDIFSALLTFCAANSPVTGKFPTQRPVTQSFDIFFDLCLNNGLSKQ